MINHKNIYILSFILLCVTAIVDVILGIAFIWYLFPLLFLFVVLLVGSFNMSSNFFLKSFTHAPQSIDKRIAITFDDGPNPGQTPKVLKLLSQYNATATFFCIGEKIKMHPEVLKQIVKEGHSIGNHSFTHSKLISFHNAEDWIKEIKKTDEIIEDTLALKTFLFRPPFGVTTPNLKKAIDITGHSVIGWNIRPFDTIIKNNTISLWQIKRKVKPGSIILLHDTHNRIEYILEHLLQFLDEHNYKTVSINDLLHEK